MTCDSEYDSLKHIISEPGDHQDQRGLTSNVGPDTPGFPWNAFDKSGTVEIENHLVNTWRGNLEESPHISLGRRSPEHLRIGMDEGQVLALLYNGPWSWRLDIVV